VADGPQLRQRRLRAGQATGASGRSRWRRRGTAIEILLDGRTSENLDERTLLDVDKRAGALTLESTAKRATIRLHVLSAALGWLRTGQQTKTPRLLGADFNEPGVRTGMERCYRELARESTGMWERIELVEKANAIRPRTRV
jgi:serine/threonine-protein kinase PknG